jgi:hypothetical protein
LFYGQHLDEIQIIINQYNLYTIFHVPKALHRPQDVKPIDIRRPDN